MGLRFKIDIETKAEITKIKENQKHIGNEYLKKTKININITKRNNKVTKNSKDGKRIYIYANNKKKIKTIQDSNNLQSEDNYSINKSSPKILSYSNFMLFQKTKFINSKIILIINLLFLFCKSNQERLLFKLSEIILKIRGPGNISILSDNFFQKYNPYEIEINASSKIIKNKYYVNNLENITVKVVWNDTITNTSEMFQHCDNIIEIDLSNFNASQITRMDGMFYGCSSLRSLTLTNLDTSQVSNMRNMFRSCSSLSSLNLSNFKTSLVTTMRTMFYNCSSLISLDLSNFDTSNVSTLAGMFNNCSSLKSLILSNFSTSKVTDMSLMFYLCSKLEKLNLSNFDTSEVIDMVYMFSSCAALTSLNLYNFNTSKVKNMSHMFDKCSHLNSLNLSSFDTSQV